MKIFGIGLNKTGTTTLNDCGLTLGFRCCSARRDLLEDVVVRDDLTSTFERVKDYDLFQDWPFPLIYQELDNQFPNSKFILTVRTDANTWYESLKAHSMRTHPTKHCRKLAYGFNYPHYNKQAHLDLYHRHNENIRDYFKDRDEQFLEVCWEKGDDWSKLCDFLNAEVPDLPLPHSRKGMSQTVSLPTYALNRAFSLLRN